MSSVSAVSNTVLKRSVPFCSHDFRVIAKTITCSSNIHSQQLSLPTIHGGAVSLKSSAGALQAMLAGTSHPQDRDNAGTPPEFPPIGPDGDAPSVPPEVPPLTTSPEVEPGGAPPEVRENRPTYDPDPTPEIEFPKPPVGPPPGPDVPPMPPGPDILPPDRPPVPEIDPPRTPSPEFPPVRPPGPEIVPPPDIKPPPGSPFGEFGF